MYVICPIESFSKSVISIWSSQINSIPAHLFIFIRKAFLHQLPTAANLQKWKKKLAMDNCSLCGSRQTNKRVLSHGNSPQTFSRFKTRHDNILRILADWISEKSKPNSVIHVDLEVFFFFFRMLAQSFTPNIYTPTPIPLLYNPFTIVLHKSLCAYLFRAAHTPACWIGTKRNKDFHHATLQPIGNQVYWPNPSRMWI